MKRAALAWFTAATLFAQGAAWAFAGPMLPPVQAEQGMPCHDDGGSAEKAAAASMPCCADECHCADLCGGHAAVVAPKFSFSAPAHADFQLASFRGLRLSINHTERLRPPIAL